MKNLLRDATSMALVALMIGLMFPAVTLRAAAAQKSPAKPAPADEEAGRFTPFKDRLPAGVLRGQEAQRRVRQLRATSKALNRAMGDRERQGKTIKWDASAVIVFAKPGAQKPSTTPSGDAVFTKASFSPARETLSDGSGEVTFITYEGAPNTWDGTIYRTDYYTGESEVFNADMYDFGSVDDPAMWDVTEEIYYPPDGGEPCSSNRETTFQTYDQYQMVEPCTMASAPQPKGDALGMSDGLGLMRKASFVGSPRSPRAVGSIWRWFTNFWRCYSRTLAYRGAVCVSPQPNIRNNLICFIAAGIYAAGCCARFAHNNAGRGYCYQ